MKPAINSAKTLWKQHGPEIMSGLTVIGFGATIFSCARSSIKAIDLIREEENKLAWEHLEGESERTTLTNAERLKLVWPILVTPTLLATTTIACILLTHRVNANRTAAATAAYALADRAYSEYKDVVFSKKGEEFAKDIKEEVVRRQASSESRPDPGNVFTTGDGMVLTKDSVSGRYFYSSVDAIKRAENEVNKRLYQETFISLSEFYGLINLDETNISDNLGWDATSPLDIFYTTQMTADDKPCVYLMYEVHPLQYLNSNY